MNAPTMADVVLVGECNPYDPDPYFALYPRPIASAGSRLQRLILAVSEVEYLRSTRVNLCVGRWGMAAARARASEVRAQHPRVVLLGAKVAAAFDLDFEPFTVARLGGGAGGADEWLAALLPHPSGLSRSWNAPGAFQRARGPVLELWPGLQLGELDDKRSAGGGLRRRRE